MLLFPRVISYCALLRSPRRAAGTSSGVQQIRPGRQELHEDDETSLRDKERATGLQETFTCGSSRLLMSALLR